MRNIFKRIKRNKRGAEVIETLIVVALMGSLAIISVTGLGQSLLGKTTEVQENINNIDIAFDAE